MEQKQAKPGRALKKVSEHFLGYYDAIRNMDDYNDARAFIKTLLWPYIIPTMIRRDSEQQAINDKKAVSEFMDSMRSYTIESVINNNGSSRNLMIL